MSINCPLCGNTRNLRKTEEVQLRDIRRIYSRRLGVQIGDYDAETVEYWHCGSCDLRFFIGGVVGDGAFYEELQKFDWYYLEDKAEFHTALKYMPAGAVNMVEIGCGAGRFARHLPAGVRYVGLEFNDRAVSEAKTAGVDVRKVPVEVFAEANPESADLVCSFQVLEHVEDPAGFLKAAVGLLRTEGRLVISVPAEDSFLANEINSVLNMPPHHQSRWSDVALSNVAGVTGTHLLKMLHEPLEAINVDGFAKAEVLRRLRGFSGWKPPLVSGLFDSMPVRATLRALGAPLRWRLRNRAGQERGHTVTAIYEKR